mmetsp:Transcript_19275/g.74024  ORF Transcript_19275/g.74024 Transcript_19275/m.74024 type:complete len:447 (-) Transcript_19275:88-1428(-)|eukprot:CAMPEP_0114626486 /NCGR_PEP_ID=MMETSP0168-20121206/11807_1 /TAXON_ID=95228 ORGANISM="Vannella sp., Strain DIVA3 517/6/12" /NCGR_SAMPLE_ID=MMETSP0168 /ASSEMBLY_ACC=CAM_ASM_000044 /LENGTH=446 /DNA_ID=CAMNT_0001837793 /DNA_START=25 /DNA_END=1365 /DNA_ORIENTATION=+
MTVTNGAEDAFLRLHAAQLKGAGLPPALQRRLAAKLVGEDNTDASELEERETGEAFQLVDLEDAPAGELSLRLAAKRKIAKESDVFFLEHAWTPGLLGARAREQLAAIEPLRETLWGLLQVEKTLTEKERELYAEYEQAVSLRRVVPSISHEQAVSCLRESSWDLVSATMMASTGEIPGLSSDQPAAAARQPAAPYPAEMALCEAYCWTQDAETVEVFVALPLAEGETAEKQKVTSLVSGKRWRLSYDGHVLLDGELTAAVESDMWQFHNERTLLMHMEKQEQAQRWSAVLEGEERVADPASCRVEYRIATQAQSEREESASASGGSDNEFVTEKEIADFIMRRLEQGPALGQYYVVAGGDGVSAVWFLHSERGCGVRLLPYREPGQQPPAGEEQPNCACRVFINQNTGRPLTILWPLVDLAEGDFVSCARISRDWQQEHGIFEAQ